MKNYRNVDNKKLMLKLEKPHLLNIFSNNKHHYKLNAHVQNKYDNNNSFSPLLKEPNNKTNAITLNNLPNNKTNNNSPIKTKIKYPNNILKTTPLKFQYKKIPFEKVKGYKIKLPNPTANKKRNHNNYKNNVLNTFQNNYPLICDHNHSKIQSNKNNIKEKPNKRSYSYLANNNRQNKVNSYYSTLTQKLDTINDDLNKEIKENNIIIKNKENKNSKKPLYHLIETKSSSIGSKLETREESGHFLKSRSKSFINSPQLFNNINLINNINNLKKKNFQFLRFDKMNNKIKIASKKKILKYLDKTIKQLTKIKTIILDEKKCEEDKDNEKNKEKEINEENAEDKKIQEEIQNKYIKIDLLKIGKHLDKYKNKIDIDKNTINISYEANNKEIYPYNNNTLNKKLYKNTFKKLNRTITYDNLKSNVKEKQKLMQIEQKSFKNFKKFNFNKRNKSENNNKYNTINTYAYDYLGYKGMMKNNENNYTIKNYDTEIKIPKLNIGFNKNENADVELNKIKEEDSYLNNENKTNGRYADNEGDNIADIANFEFSD